MFNPAKDKSFCLLLLQKRMKWILAFIALVTRVSLETTVLTFHRMKWTEDGR
jgi:hypothetical protein